MSLYTTGELARRCKVSVRTVQYYDERGILVPTELSEGGRRLFSENDVATLETICFLRDLDISIRDIAEILQSDESKKAIELLLDGQEKAIQEDIARKSAQLDKIRGIRSSLASFRDGSQKTIHDISTIMKETEKRKKMYRNLLILALPLELAVIATLVLGVAKGIWLPLIVAAAAEIIGAGFMLSYWHKRIAYICPECHTRFRPRLIEAALGVHTPRMRKLPCPVCNRKIWCIEVYEKEEDAQ